MPTCAADCGLSDTMSIRFPGAAAWRRHLGLLLDGLRAERAYPLPPPPRHPG